MGATTLPVQLTSFVGREKETADLRQLLESSRLITVTGAGGCGKTRLALRLAESMQEYYADGVFWVEFGAATDEPLVPQALIKALHISSEAGDSPTSILIEYLSGRQALIVLDNCEHLVEACAKLVESLLQAPGIRVLITSRQPLLVEGETLYSLAPLSTPPVASGNIDFQQF